MCYLAAEFDAGQSVAWPRHFPEEAVYLVNGSLEVDGEAVPEHAMAVLPEGDTVRLHSPDGARIALLGGEPIGPRFLVWNFVSSSRERIREAAEHWKSGGFDRVPGDEEFIPWPEDLPI